MPGFALLMLQVAVAAPPAPDERLLHVIPQHRCTGSSTEIVVCAQNKDAYRLPDTGPQIDEPALPKAEWRLFGDTKMGVSAAQRSLPGASAPAAMVTVTVPF